MVSDNDRSAWQGSTPPSLIQQRMQIDRARTGSVVLVVMGVVWAALGTVRFVDSGPSWLVVSQAVIAAGLFVWGVVSARRARRTLAAFEAEYGRDAGKQDPIR